MTEQWGQENQAVSPRVQAVAALVGKLDQNDADYLAEKVTREEWLEVAKGVDEKLAVAGLRIAVRPWARDRQ